MKSRPNILVVCGKNKKRSRTAEFIFKNDSRFAIRSVGVSPQSERKISENDLQWANLILVMENKYREKILELYGQKYFEKIGILEIPDEYEFMDEELVELLNEKINDVISEQFNL